MTHTKQCTRCKRTLPLDRFAWMISRGYRIKRGACGECMASYYREYNAKRRAMA